MEFAASSRDIQLPSAEGAAALLSQYSVEPAAPAVFLMKVKFENLLQSLGNGVREKATTPLETTDDTTGNYRRHHQ